MKQFSPVLVRKLSIKSNLSINQTHRLEVLLVGQVETTFDFRLEALYDLTMPRHVRSQD